MHFAQILLILIYFIYHSEFIISTNIKNAKIVDQCSNRRIVAFFNHMEKKRPFTEFQASKLTHLILHTTFVDQPTLHIEHAESEDEMADYEETVRIGRTNPNLKIMVSIGGPDIYSTFFSPSLANSTKRAIFIRNIVEFINESKLDGINIWWEPNAVSQKDKKNFALFIKELRTEFDSKFQYKLQISILTTKHPDLIRTNYPLKEMANYTDFMHSLSYGYYSPRTAEKMTGPLAPIYKSRPFERNEYLQQTMKELSCGAGDPKEINLGIGFYAWNFGRVSSRKLWEMDDMWRLADENTIFGSKKINYRELINLYNLSNFKFHDLAKTVYHYDSENGSFIGAENLKSIKLKLDYASDFGLGGIMISNIDHDDDNDTLLNYINEEWIEKCQNNHKREQNYSCDYDSLDQLTNPVIFPLKREWLSNQEKCCNRVVEERNNNQDITMNCNALARGLSPAKQNNGHNDKQYHQFFTECILANASHTECCRKKNVSDECLALCNGNGIPALSFKEMNALIELNCSILTQEIAAECALEIYEFRKAKIIVVHYTVIIVVIFVAICLIILNKCRQRINSRKRAKLAEILQIGYKLGKGRFAQVHEAKWHGKQVALKRLFAEANAEMNREFQLLKRLEHPNLCRTLEVVMIEKKLGILMEFAEYGDLQNFLYNHKPSDDGKHSGKFILKANNLIEISSMIASGLKYLFSKNIIHRDLATRNCLVFRSNNNNPSAIAFGHLIGIIVKISDFGLARILDKDSSAYYASYSYAWLWNCFGFGPKIVSAMDESSEIQYSDNGEYSENSPFTEETTCNSGQNVNDAENHEDDTVALLCSAMQIDVFRKKNYPLLPILVAPECLNNRKYTVQSDIWSFGIFLIELFDYGKRPFENEHPEAMQAKICSGILPEMPKNAPKQIKNLIVECCNMDPKMRIEIAEICKLLEMMKFEGKRDILETTL